MEKFLKTMRLPVTVHQVKRLVGFVLFLRSFLPNLSHNLMQWYNLLRKGVEFVLNDEHFESFAKAKKEILPVTQRTPSLP